MSSAGPVSQRTSFPLHRARAVCRGIERTIEARRMAYKEHGPHRAVRNTGDRGFAVAFLANSVG